MQNKQAGVNGSWQLHLLTVVMLGAYGLGYVYPDQWWASHALAFLPGHSLLVFVAVALACVLWHKQLPLNLLGKVFQQGRWTYILFSIGLTLAAVSLCYYFPIQLDIKGDALRFATFFERLDNRFFPRYMDALLDPSLLYWKNGERTVLNFAHYLTHLNAWGPRQSFVLINLVCAALYLLLVMWFLRHYHLAAERKALALVMLVLAPWVWMLFGHMEIYSPALLLNSFFGMLLLLFFQQPSQRLLVLLLLMLYWVVRFHTGNVLLLLPMVLTVLWFYQGQQAWMKRWFHWRGLFLLVLVPVAVMGLYLYFVVFEDHIEPRTLAPLSEQIFLPLFSPPAPLDGYDLLSTAHLFDYLTHGFMLSAAALFVVLSALLIYRHKIAWQSPVLLIMGLALIIYLGFFFMMNPLLGMPLDMDLFSITAPFLILFAIALLQYLPSIRNGLAGTVCALSVLGVADIAVNADAQASYKQLTSLGVRTFNTYWMGGMAPMLQVLKHQQPPLAEYTAYIEDVERRIGPYITAQNDIEYSAFAYFVASDYEQRFSQYDKARQYYQTAYYHNVGNHKAALSLMQIYFREQQFAKAYALGQHLLSLHKPGQRKALRMLIHCAIMMDDYDRALLHSEQFVGLWPDDAFIQQVHRVLVSGNELEQLKHVFAK